MAIRFNAHADRFERTASLPTATAFTMCGWGQITTDVNNWACIAALHDDSSFTFFTTTNDGTSLRVSGNGSESATILSLAVGDRFFWSVSQNGTGAGAVVGYARLSSSPALSTQSTSGASYTPTTLQIGSNFFSEFWDGRIWNVKCWDRVLTGAELLIESYYRRVMFPSSLNFHWHMDVATDIYDYGGNVRNASQPGGTSVSTEDGPEGLWTPRRKIIQTGGPPPASPLRWLLANSGRILLGNSGRYLRA